MCWGRGTVFLIEGIASFKLSEHRIFIHELTYYFCLLWIIWWNQHPSSYKTKDCDSNFGSTLSANPAILYPLMNSCFLFLSLILLIPSHALHLWPWPVLIRTFLSLREGALSLGDRHLCHVSLRYLKPHISELDLISLSWLRFWW